MNDMNSMQIHAPATPNIADDAVDARFDTRRGWKVVRTAQGGDARALAALVALVLAILAGALWRPIHGWMALVTPPRLAGTYWTYAFMDWSAYCSIDPAEPIDGNVVKVQAISPTDRQLEFQVEYRDGRAFLMQRLAPDVDENDAYRRQWGPVWLFGLTRWSVRKCSRMAKRRASSRANTGIGLGEPVAVILNTL